jgi:hypothetical protein
MKKIVKRHLNSNGSNARLLINFQSRQPAIQAHDNRIKVRKMSGGRKIMLKRYRQPALRVAWNSGHRLKRDKYCHAYKHAVGTWCKASGLLAIHQPYHGSA